MLFIWGTWRPAKIIGSHAASAVCTLPCTYVMKPRSRPKLPMVDVKAYIALNIHLQVDVKLNELAKQILLLLPLLLLLLLLLYVLYT